MEAQAALNLAGGEAVAGGWTRGEPLAQERFDLGGPGRGMVAARGARHPGKLAAGGAGAQIVGVEFIEASAPEAEFGGGGYGTDLPGTKGREHLADKGRSETVDELLVMFFIAARIRGERRRREPASAWRRCAECSPLLATRHNGSHDLAIEINRIIIL